VANTADGVTCQSAQSLGPWVAVTDDRSDVKDARVRLADASTSVTGESVRASDGRDAAANGRDRDVDSRVGVADGLAAHGERRVDVGTPSVGPNPAPDGVDREVVAEFIARVETRRAIHARVAASVAREDVDDLVQTTWVEAVRAADRTPPADENAVPAWLKTIAERVVADHLARRARRGRYEGPMPDADVGDQDAVEASEQAVDPREGEPVESEAWLVHRWLAEATAAHPRDRETLAILLEHFRDGVPYTRIAATRGISLSALSSRIFEFKTKYAKRVARRRDRAILWFVLGAAAVAVVVAWWLTRRPAALPKIEPDRSVDPARSAAPLPSFDQALPPRPTPPPFREDKPRRP
jgi:DNA-directed RNA polymerase specialized sigma24 family protein